MVLAEQTDVLRHVASNHEQALAEVQRRFGVVPGAEQATVAAAGHMLHHDRPEAVARLIDDFLRRRA
jgi:pimeloyl-ACP methyl ester carboxylesterase